MKMLSIIHRRTGCPLDEEDKYCILPYFWVPEETLELRVRRDHVPYDVWERQGKLMTTEGNVVHYGYIEKYIERLGERFNIREIAFDRWGAVQMVQNLEGMGFTVVPFTSPARRSRHALPGRPRKRGRRRHPIDPWASTAPPVSPTGSGGAAGSCSPPPDSALEAYSKHGFNIHGVVFDELHTQPNRKLFDVMTKGSVGGAPVHLRPLLPVPAGKEQRHSGGKLRLALLLRDLNICCVELAVAVRFQSAENVTDDLLLPVNQLKGLPCPCPLGVAEALDEHHGKIGGVLIIAACGDGEERAEVYGCAADRQQATIVFDVAADMVRMCPALNKRVKILASQKRIIYTPTNSFYQVLSAEAYSKHGFNIHGVVFDELHTQPNRRSKATPRRRPAPTCPVSSGSPRRPC